MSAEPYVSVKEAASYLGVSERTVIRWVNHGSVPSYKVGRARRFKLSELDVWVAEQSRGAA